MTSENKQDNNKIYINRKKPLVTFILVGICVAVFIIDQITGYLLLGKFSYGMLSFWGMKINEYIIAGQVWRLITSVFLHLDFYHIGFNMIALFYWGRNCEALYDKRNFLFIYLLAGLLGSLGSFAFSDANGLGASGAIYGIFGALLYLLLYNRKIFLKIFGKQTIIYASISLTYGFFLPQIDNYAHLFGLLGGFLAAGIFGLIKQKTKRKVALFLGVYIAICVVCIIIGYVFT